MSYNAVVCNVMIASPSDVQKERDMAREVIWIWNYLHSERTKIVLMPVAWETHTAPAMGDRPQAIINKQILRNCDLLIGIFWTRLGTPTGQEASGTVEEINAHREEGKPLMLYFSSAPVHPDSLDAVEYQRLKDFKEQCKKEGLIDTYNDVAEFKDKLTRHLIKTVDDNEYFKNLVSESIPSELLEASTVLTSGPQLSKEARDLLLEAAAGKDGYVLRVMTSGGLTIQTNKKNLVTSPKDARCQALWEAALNELVQHGLLEGRGSKGETFRVTRDGYELADQLKAAG